MENIYANSNITLALTLNDQFGNAIPLNGATVTVKLMGPFSNPVKTSIAATVTNATTGQCSASIAPSSIATAGSYEYQGFIQFSDGTQTYSDIGSFNVSLPLF